MQVVIWVPKGPTVHASVREQEYTYVHMLIYSLFSCQSEQLSAENPQVKDTDLKKCNSRVPKNNGGNDLLKAFLVPDLS